MSVPLALLAYAALVMLVVPRVLTNKAWATRAPRLGVLAWQASVLSALSALSLLAVAAVLPVERVSLDLGHVIHACTDMLEERYSVAGADVLHTAGAVVAGLTLLSLLRSTLLRGRAVRRGRRRQRQLLDVLAAHRDDLSGVHVVEHEVPTAYCVPGSGGRVVLTTGALSRLSKDEVGAVLAHEDAHLRGRHDLVLFGADVAAHAFPWSGFFRTAQEQMTLLVEMVADDDACRLARPEDVATALVSLGQYGRAAVPHGALGAAGNTIARVERLLDGRPDVRRSSQTAVLVTCAVLLAAPWVLAVAPAWAARAGRCPAAS